MAKRARFERPTEVAGNSYKREAQAEAKLPDWQKQLIAERQARDAAKSGLTVKRIKKSEMPESRTAVLQLAANGTAFSEIGTWWPRRGFVMLDRETAIAEDKYPWWSSDDKETSVPFGSMPGEQERVRANIGKVPFDCIDPDGLPSRGSTKEGRN